MAIDEALAFRACCAGVKRLYGGAGAGASLLALAICCAGVARVLRGFLRWRLTFVVRALNGRFAGVERALCCFARGRPLRCVGCFLFSLLRLLLGLLF